MDYIFVTPKELAQKLYNGKYNHSIGFTNDTEEDIFINGEPTGWYGVQINYLYDGETLMFGYYGAGVIYSCNLMDDDSIDKIETEIKRFLTNEFGKANAKICVDIKEFEEV